MSSPSWKDYLEFAREYFLFPLVLIASCGLVLCSGSKSPMKWVRDPVGMTVSSFRAEPKVVSAQARYLRGLVDSDVEVICTITNEGSSGTVNVFATVVTASERWKKTETIRMKADGVAEVRFLFPEFRNGQATYAVTTDERLANDPRLQQPVSE